MSKWRPTKSGNLYCIPDCHGQIDELNLILDRILPLRNNKTAKDTLVFLGDYIDRGNDTPGIIDKLIELKKAYPNQVTFLLGNHEWMLLSALGRHTAYDPMMPSTFSMWINNGGEKTAIDYANRQGVQIKPKELPQDRVLSFLDTKHMDFLHRETVEHYETDQYIFVHGGCDPTKPMNEQDLDTFIWDRSLYAFCKKMASKGEELPWEKTVVSGHNGDGVFFKRGFLMLDASLKGKLMVAELNSMQAFAAYWGNKRLVKENIKETVVKPSLLRRVENK